MPLQAPHWMSPQQARIFLALPGPDARMEYIDRLRSFRLHNPVGGVVEVLEHAATGRLLSWLQQHAAAVATVAVRAKRAQFRVVPDVTASPELDPYQKALARLTKKGVELGKIYKVPRHSNQDDTFEPEDKWITVPAITNDNASVHVERMNERGEREKFVVPISWLLDQPIAQPGLDRFPAATGAVYLRDLTRNRATETAIVKAVLQSLAPGAWKVHRGAGTGIGWLHASYVGEDRAAADRALHLIGLDHGHGEGYHVRIPASARSVANAVLVRKEKAEDAAPQDFQPIGYVYAVEGRARGKGETCVLHVWPFKTAGEQMTSRFRTPVQELANRRGYGAIQIDPSRDFAAEVEITRETWNRSRTPKIKPGAVVIHPYVPS